jgi:ATP synthase protein I
VKTPDPPEKRGSGGMRYAGLGVQLAASVLLFVWLGQWLDRKLGTGGILTVVFAFLGFGGTMYWLIRALGRGGKDGAE